MSFDFSTFDLSPGFRVLEAGAGSGKTFNLVKLVGRLAQGSGVSKDGDIRRVVLVTFTRSAALEMRQRARAELEQAGMRRALQQLGGGEQGGLIAHPRRQHGGGVAGGGDVEVEAEHRQAGGHHALVQVEEVVPDGLHALPGAAIGGLGRQGRGGVHDLGDQGG